MYQKTLLGFAALALAASAVRAQNTESWVWAAGSDANPCTLASPCKTFQAAHDATFDGGVIHALSSGEYGRLNITKGLTLDGAGAAAVTFGALFVNVQSKTVIIRNVATHTNGNECPINANLSTTTTPPVLVLENVTVTAPLPPATNSDAIQINGDAQTQVSLKNVSVTGGTNSIDLTGGVQAVMDGVSQTGASGNGLLIPKGSVIVRNSKFSSNLIGITIRTGATVLLDGVSTTLNTTGIAASGTSTTRLSNSEISANGTGIDTSGGGTVISFRNNVIAGNTVDGAPALSTSLR
jgi:hypothetical protein